MVSTIPVFGLRKGAWTEEEDILLRNCTEKYGEGKWHQVPHRAGLNRCRKSCRLRWLNYLRPKIKRGNFAHDEVDLRWSLIAGRLPGRTANDVKNYWNTHLRWKHTSIRENNSHGNASETSACKVVKPQPRTFSRKLREKSTNTGIIKEKVNFPSPSVSSIAKDDDVRQWWETLFANSTKDQIGEGTTSWSSLSGSEEEHVKGLWSDEISPRVDQEDDNELLQEKQRGWGGVSIDMDLWDVFTSDEVVM